MTAGWVDSWDDAWNQADLALMHKNGYRVLAGYVAGGSTGKWSSKARIAQWLAFGDTGFMPLFESSTGEAVQHPDMGDDDARVARAAARARGIPDSVAICPAVDLDISMAQAKGVVSAYMKAWGGADTVKPVPYVEADAGLWYYSEGISLGSFIPAAFGWSQPGLRYDASNAAAHMLSIQEHNGIDMNGGNVDIGQTRLGAHCVWWAKPAPPAPKPPTPPHAPGSRTLIYRPGSGVTMTGADVKYIQTFIGPKHCGAADSKYGPTTATGVSWYEDLRGIHREIPYGVAGPQVWANMGVKYTG